LFCFQKRTGQARHVSCHPFIPAVNLPTMKVDRNTSLSVDKLLPKKGEDVELLIDSLAYGGKGVARQDGFVVFVERTLPGQKVMARITRRRKGYAEARVLEVLQQSPASTEPRCPHFGTCGGCATQNYPYEKQLEQKQAQVADLFERMGGFRGVAIEKIVGCEEIYHYRNKMEFTFSPHVWAIDPDKIGDTPDWALGLHVPGRFDKVLDIQECWIQNPVADEIYRWLRERIDPEVTEPYSIRSHRGFLRHLVIRVAGIGIDQLEIMVNMVTSREKPELLKPMAEELMATFPQVTSVVNNINTRKAAIAFGEREIVLGGKSTITEQVGDLAFEISANSFFQTNTRQAEVLYRQIAKACALTGNEVVYDLFTGTGTIALSLASKAQDVFGFEVVEPAVDDAARNALLNEIYNARFFQADLSARFFTEHAQRLAGQVPAPDVIVSDPPRAGMHPKLIQEILDLKPRRVVYVSCNPATQVRDIRLLAEGGYRLLNVQPIDMFPHTPHIENICVLEL
jgi:23S rRNA (uracil1939-C5)-methyltransferase